jgi:hypothetical protein
MVVLRSAPTRTDMNFDCTLYSAAGHRIGRMQTVDASWFADVDRIADGTSGRYDFVVLDAYDRPRLFLRRRRRGHLGRLEVFEVRDAAGVPLMAIRSSSSTRVDPPRLTIEALTGVVAHTETWASEESVVHDAAGHPVARVSRIPLDCYTFGPKFFDYAVHFLRPVHDPLGSLPVAVMLAQYVSFRIEHGGPRRVFDPLRPIMAIIRLLT